MSSTIKQLENLLNYCTEKNKIIAKNISNVGTENYKREDIAFKNLLDENSGNALKTSNGKHLPLLSMGSKSEKGFDVIYNDSEEAESGINNVTIEQEMSELAENTLRFKFASKKVGDYYRSIQNVIKSAR